MVILQEQEDESEEIPAPKRKKMHPQAWRDNFGQDSSAAAVGCRRYQYEVLHQWDVTADGVTVEGFDQTVPVDPDEVQARLAELKPATVTEEDE